jgi:hypothetical protein
VLCWQAEVYYRVGGITIAQRRDMAASQPFIMGAISTGA